MQDREETTVKKEVLSDGRKIQAEKIVFKRRQQRQERNVGVDALLISKQE